MNTAKMTTTEQSPAKRRRRASKKVVRTWAWVAGLISFFAPAAALASNVDLSAPQATAQAAAQRVVIIRHLVRRVIIVDPAAPATPTRSVSLALAPVAPAPVAAPPVTTTQGS